MNSKDAKLTQKTITEIYHRINQKKYEKKFGASCMFLPLNKKVGVKLYLRKDNRNFAWRHQKNLSTKELAPQTGQCFEIEVGTVTGRSMLSFNPRTLFGFFTEVAEKVRSKDLKYKEYEVLKKDLTKLKYCTSDAAARNLGRVNGKLVLIDTDMISLRG